MRGPARPWRPRILWWVAGFALVLGALLALALAHLRVEALRAGEQVTQALAQVIAEQTTRSLQVVDVRLQLAGHELRVMGAEGPLDTEAARAMLRKQLEGLPFVRNLWVIDPQGTILFWSNEGAADFSVRDREYFRFHLDSPEPGFFVGRVVSSRVTHKGIVVASRSVRDPDGRVQWVIAAAIEPPYFQSAWREMDLGAQGVIGLFHRSGQLMIRSPANEQAMGRDLSQLPLFTRLLPASPDGVLRIRSVLDEVDRVVAYRTLPLYPQLIVNVGSSVSQLLAPWNRFAWLTGGLWTLALAAATVLGWQLQRQSLRRRHIERRFGELAQAMPQIVFTTDADGTVEFVNERWTAATGLLVETAIGAKWEQLCHPDDRARVAAHRAEWADAGMPVSVEMRLRQADGSYRWQLVRAMPNHGSRGDIVSWYGTSTDVHELKMAQEQLERQAEMLRMAGRLARMGSWYLDVRSGRIGWSEQARAVFGFEDAVPQRLTQLLAGLPTKSRETVEAALRKSIHQGVPFEAEGEVSTAGGHWRWLRAMAEPVRDASGAVVRLQGAVQDVTQQMHLVEQVRQLNATLEQRIERRTRELQQQEALFRTLTEEAPLPIWTMDPQGRITFISRAWYELVGGAPPRWLGNEWIELIHPDDLARMREDWVRCRVEGCTFQGTRRLRARDGTWHTTTYRASPVRGEDGQIAFWVGVDTDITDLIAQETALRLANEQLQSFSYSVSHDLQSPLQRIGAFAQLLQQELGTELEGTRAAHFLQRIRANAEEMVQLVQGLLSLARVSQAEIVRGRVDLSGLAVEILERMKAETPERDVRWRVEPGLLVLGDVRLMRSVLENLLGNAWKFTSGTERAEIEFGGAPPRGEFFVRDNGAGFDMAHAGKLFGTFQRLHRQDEFPGTGVGLATVARAVTRQGGRVWAEAQPGLGATFWFTMPVPDA
ncbi:PAS domain-containing protein [Ramlibacter tataouinensis]|uniref:PAS domain-containing protein n=1 Tax=Ramlibacter tataouinensis TaxID=94132 RepID=UPI0022F3E6F2|nr:PAS domain-containing protein [Ramlibacter tataouinensis]WBY01391.1 PAS domain-containing protein [Ramlibacter tataouinensis]